MATENNETGNTYPRRQGGAQLNQRPIGTHTNLVNFRVILDHPCRDFHNKFGIKLKLIFLRIVYCYWHMVHSVEFFRYFAIQKVSEKINKTHHSELRTGSCSNPPQNIALETKMSVFFSM